MNFVIGDVHGEITKLTSLIDLINKLDDQAAFVFIGDYIDKGEDSRSTLAYLKALCQVSPCSFLMGNHEYCWINLADKDKDYPRYLLNYGGLNTMRSFNSNDIFIARDLMLEEFSTFFNSLRPFYQTDSFLVTHSGIDPKDFHLPIEEISIEALLFNRYKFIANQAFYLNNKRVIFGHTGFFRPYVDDFKIGVDTAACFLKGQPLTAYCLEKNLFINSDGQVDSCRVHKDHCPNIVRLTPWRSIC